MPGRAFTRRFYSKMGRLKPHHHVRVDAEMKSDCKTWLQFLNMKEALCRPFLDFATVLHADQIDFCMDAALDGVQLGVGGRFNSQWFSGILILQNREIHRERLTIQIGELYSIFLALSLWIPQLCNRRVVLFTDNESVMHMLNRSSSTCKTCMIMLRLITLWSMQHNVRIFAAHIPTEDNTEADYLSRGLLKRYFEITGGVDNQKRFPLPEEYCPLPEQWLL